jgi:hypothetical protein
MREPMGVFIENYLLERGLPLTEANRARARNAMVTPPPGTPHPDPNRSRDASIARLDRAKAIEFSW